MSRIRAAIRAAKNALTASPRFRIGSGRLWGFANASNQLKYKQEVERSVRMYCGEYYIDESDRERAFFQMFVELASTWISGAGVNIASNTERGQEYVDLVKNSVDTDSVAREIAEALLLEGQTLPRITVNRRQASIEVYKWYDYEYYIDDDKVYFADGAQVDAKQYQYISTKKGYKKIQYPFPISASAYKFIKSIADAYDDWRSVNHKFGFSAPFFETETYEMADMINEQLDSKVWKLGVAMAAPAKASYLTPPPGAMQGLDQEIDKNLQAISGFFGIPVNILGFISLFGTKAGADSLNEQVNARSAMLRNRVQNGLHELLVKGWRQYISSNVITDTDPEISVVLPPVSLEAMRDIVQDWLPIYDRSLVSGQTITEKLPNVNLSEEKERIESEREQRELERRERQSATGRDIFDV